MFILLEVLILAASALLVSKFAPEPWRSRILSVLKAYFTVRAFWLLLSHPIAMEEGLRFAIREGGRTVGAGVVTKITE